MIAPLTADRTLELAAYTRQIFAATRSLITISRRCLNPWWGVSGGSEDGAEVDGLDGSFFHSIRTRLESGVLIPAPDEEWAGYGTGKTCTICTQKIQSYQIENEMSVRGGGVEIKFWAHLRCLKLWRTASRVFKAKQQPSASQHPF